MMGLNMQQIIKIGKTVLNVGSSLYLLKSMGYFYKPNETKVNKKYATNCYDAVDIIVNSDMLDSYKKEAIELVVEGFKTPSYYQTVANIINGDMLDSYKIELIKTLSIK